MESSEQTGPYIDPSICTKRLIIGKGAFFILFVLNTLTTSLLYNNKLLIS